MGTVVNLRRLERLEAKTGGTGLAASLSDAELDGLILAAATGELPCGDHDGAASYVQESLKTIARSYSNYPNGFGSPDGSLDETLNVLQELGAPKAATMIVEAVKEDRLSAAYLWPDWRKGLSEKVLKMIEET